MGAQSLVAAGDSLLGLAAQVLERRREAVGAVLP
jgi:hypothetical protein